MSKKQTPLPPGEYTVVVERVRKVRNKPAKRIHMRIIDGEYAGREIANTIREE